MTFIGLRSACFRSLPLSVALSILCPVGSAQDDRHQPIDSCGVDLTVPAQMRDVLSNVLMLALSIDEGRVVEALNSSLPESRTGIELMNRVAGQLEVDAAQLEELVRKFHHVNCAHDHPAQQFARDVTNHVVLHELGHALVREFDLPILANEEALADAFATFFLTQHVSERASQVLSARVRSLMFEAAQVPRDEWEVRGEHNSDARRAFQIAALAISADPKAYRSVADLVGMSESDRRRAIDYGAEILRSWRRVLGPLFMPAGQPSKEVRIDREEGERVVGLLGPDLLEDLERHLRRFDWHSQVKLVFVDDDGGASWSRSKRAITVHGSYVQRFVLQGMQLIDLD
ncbi:MAG: DUF4344 domain-containing metallopeptidase [Planctomycetota bacterium]